MEEPHAKRRREETQEIVDPSWTLAPPKWYERLPDKPLVRLFLATDWSKTSLGPLSDWPSSFCDATIICFTSAFPMSLFLGRELVQFYNSGYIDMWPDKQAKTWAKPLQQGWPEVWSELDSLINDVCSKGEGFYMMAKLFLLQVGPLLKELYFNFSYSPVSQGRHIVGIINTVADCSNYVINNRRMEQLRVLALRFTSISTTEDMCKTLTEVLGTNTHDIPFFAYYQVTGEDLSLISRSPCGIGYPTSITGPTDTSSPLAEAVTRAVWNTCNDRTSVELDLSGYELPICGGWKEPPKSSCVTPVFSDDVLVGVLLVGLNQHLDYDDSYRDFISLVSNQVGNAVKFSKVREDTRKRLEMLSNLDRARTVFFTNVSHEFKTPITLTLGPLEDLLNRERNVYAKDVLSHKKPNLDPTQTRKIDLIYRNSLRLLKLVNNLLDFSNLDNGEFNGKFEVVDVRELTIECCNLFESSFQKSKLIFLVDCEEVTGEVLVDRDMFEKIVLNMISNSFKYTKNGSVRVSLKDGDEFVIITVEDTGIGISEIDLPHVFKRFYRGTNREARQAGTGIGLALVSELVQLHGGRVDIESKLGQGTRTTATIKKGQSHIPPDRIHRLDPSMSGSIKIKDKHSVSSSWLSSLSRTPPSGTSSPPSPGSMMSTESSHHRWRIAFLCLDSEMREYILSIIGGDYDVFVSDDVESIYTQINGNKSDLVLADISTSGPGFTLLEQMRNEPTNVNLPIIFVNARSGDNQMESLGKGVDDCLVMPFSDLELRARIAVHIRMSQAQLSVMKHEQDLRHNAEVATAAKDNFLAMLAHEMRTPLAPALMLAEEMRCDASVPEQVRHSADVIHSTVQSEVLLIDNLLDMVKISKGKLALSLTTVNVHDCLKKVGRKIQEEYSEAQMKIEWNLAAKSNYVNGDAQRLEQIFTNVMGNCVKFGRHGKLIRVDTQNVDDKIEIGISDLGIGMSEEQIATLFDPMDLQHRDPYKTTGLGLGLHITQEVARAHGGKVTAESRGINRGVTIRIALPSTSHEAEKISCSHAVIEEKKNEARPLQILLVEDNEAIRMVMNRILSKMRHGVRSSGLVSTTIDAAKEFRFDLLLSDIGLPDGTGYDLIQQVRQVALQPFKAIALSGYSLPEDVQASLDAGFDLHLTKPVQINALKEAIDSLCGTPTT
ncbi:response regulator receiver ATP-binding protein [Planoprotostelium fungivorum]|uniref:histidine kinase n=1 Tax=Planoprotostelium fungivorum TaxID=1890364 RepID=A0A2P6MYT9_9EUKA|nr:response regulator receiver ATP-binding protein [Planoprotostelium fungivorum]